MLCCCVLVCLYGYEDEVCDVSVCVLYVVCYGWYVRCFYVLVCVGVGECVGLGYVFEFVFGNWVV